MHSLEISLFDPCRFTPPASDAPHLLGAPDVGVYTVVPILRDTQCSTNRITLVFCNTLRKSRNCSVCVADEPARSISNHALDLDLSEGAGRRGIPPPHDHFTPRELFHNANSLRWSVNQASQDQAHRLTVAPRQSSVLFTTYAHATRGARTKFIHFY